MKRTLADVKQDLAACEKKLETTHDDDTLERKHELLQERSKLLLEELNPLRTVVSGLLGIPANMAVSKRWSQEFRKMAPSAQFKQYEDAHKVAVDLAVVLHIDTAPLEK
jgi:hypothetical protein